jgi:sugar transferase (PEP-CTERM system associated)
LVRLFRHYVPLPSILLAVSEAVLFFLLTTMVQGAEIRVGLVSASSSDRAVSFGVAAWVAVVTVLVMCSVGMYNRQVMYRMGAVLSRATITIPLAGLAAYVTLFAASMVVGGEPPSEAVMLAAVPACALAGFTVHGFINVLSAEHKPRVLVLGAGQRALKVAKMAEPCHFVALGFVENGEPRANSLAPVLPASVLATPESAIGFVRANGVDEILIATSRSAPLPMEALLECRLGGISVRDYASFYESQTGCLDLDELSASWLIFSDGFAMNRARRVAKAFVDYCFAILLLLLTLPITVTTALAIKLTSPGPIFFRQERVGLNGRVFQVLKFRSMRTDAEKGGPQWATPNDSRVTAVGRLIRKLRIDEIPQAINVLKGEMSFIGPRPERPVFVRSLASSIPYFNERHRVKPGITGWAQINYRYGASVEDARTKLSYDLYYLKNGGPFLDLVILLQTVRVVLWSEGAR